MTPSSDLLDDTELAFSELSALVPAALSAALQLWEGNTFRRSSGDPRASGLRPTVSFRCADVLFSAVQTDPELFDETAVKVLDEVAELVVEADPDEVLRVSELNYPLFTLALLTLSVARVAATDRPTAKKAREILEPRLQRLLEEFSRHQPGDVHPFVNDHVMRALAAVRGYVSSECEEALDSVKATIVASAERQAEQLLAKFHTSLISPGESVALAFCAAVLGGAPSVAYHPVVFAALEAVVAAQDVGGSWPLGRVVQDEPGRLEISTYEVAWVTATTLAKLLSERATTSNLQVNQIAGGVARASQFANRSVLNVDGLQGWASDHPYQSPRVESWTTSIALQFILAASNLRRELQSREALASFTSQHPQDSRWPKWLRWAKIAPGGDPEAESPVYGYLEQRVIIPIREHPRRLPSGASKTASALLFGPPGTSKTTIVKAVADALAWPVVFLSPGVFIENGLEAIEASAQSVFARLERLRRVVVIFDECDELFRDRHPSGDTEPTRNISAFVTASMLPKLQDLHDSGEVLFFVCTNHVATMDSAVTRPGRIDHRIGVGPPDADARLRILQGFCPSPLPEHGDIALHELAKCTERFVRAELERASTELWAASGWRSGGDAAKAAKMIGRKMSSSLTINQETYRRYMNDRNAISDPYVEAKS